MDDMETNRTNDIYFSLDKNGRLYKNYYSLYQ